MSLEQSAKPERAGLVRPPVARGRLARVDPLLPAGMMLLALLVRLYAWWQAPRYGFVIDEAEYYHAASILADGRGWQYFDTSTWIRPPLYLLLLAGLLKFFGPGFLAVRLVQISLSVVSVYLLYRLAARSFDRRVGLLSGLLAALAWPFATLSYLLLSETLFLFLFVLAANLLANYVRSCAALPPSPPPTGLARWRSFRWQLAAAGLVLGLAALTRGQVLSFMPFIGLWLGWCVGWRRALKSVAVLAVVFSLTVGPWLYRNATLYGRPFIDTTGGYNLYLGALGGRNEAQVINTLTEVKNQSERELLGYQKGFEILSRDVPGFVAKGVQESLDFWTINFGADERLESSYSKGAIAPAWLLPGQLLGDTFYLVTGLLAVLGLSVALWARSGSSLTKFILIWLGYNMALAFGFFAVTRFRWPVYFFLLIFAAYVLGHPRQIWKWLRLPTGWWGGRFRRGHWLTLAAPLLFGLVVLPSYSPGETALGLQEWSNRLEAEKGDALRKSGRYEEALAAYARASQVAPATQAGLALTRFRQGFAAEAITRLEQINPELAMPHLALGWLYLQQGNREYARSEFRSRAVALDAGVRSDRWAWDNLPGPPLPENLLTIGEYDWGYVEGFHGYEKESTRPEAPYFRWSGGRGESGQERSRLRFPLAAGERPGRLSLHLKGYRPVPLTSPRVEVYINNFRVGLIQTGQEWQTYSLNLPAGISGPGEVVVELAVSATFVPGANSPRELGVMLQWARLDQAARPPS